MMFGGIIPLSALGIVDAFTWGSPFRSIWLYLWFNADISTGFGRAPIYAFIGQELFEWSAFGPLIVGLAVLGTRRLPLIGVTVTAIFTTFSLFAHKESRFIYPAVPLILTLVGISSAEIAGDVARRLRASLSRSALGAVVTGFWIVVSAWLGALGPFHPVWSGGTGTVAAFRAISADPDACGAAVVPQDRWADSGGYVFLRPGIPLVALATAGNGAPTSHYNYIFTYHVIGHGDGDDGGNPAGVAADQVRCWNGHDVRGYDAKVCLWHVRQECVSGQSEPLVAVPPLFVIRAMTRLNARE